MSWGVYKNGNSTVRINLENGTKIRETEDDEFNLEFPESLDIACTTICDLNCPFCYASCSVDGKHADIMNAKFIDGLHPYTEVALQLNDLSHPDMLPFLRKLKEKNIIANITVNQIHFERKEKLIRQLVDEELVHGIGISLRKATPEFVERVKKYPNAVIHVINGILTADDLETMRDNDLKLLILGYKNLGRGIGYNEDNSIQVRARQRYLFDVLSTLPNHFKAICLDNLAIEQLNPQRFIPKDKWDTIFMGEEGTSSLYVDLVTNKFGISSLASPDEMIEIGDKSVEEMFAIVKKLAA